MPRRDYPVQLEQVLSYNERMLLGVLVQELNIVRAALGLPPRTGEHLREAFRAYLRTHPRHAPTSTAEGERT